MEKVPHLEIINCGAVHDARCEPKGARSNRNYSLPFCALNGICSHGNPIIARAIEQGVAQELITPEQQAAMLKLLAENRMQMQRWSDLLSTIRHGLRQGSLNASEDRGASRKYLEMTLGPDRHHWTENQLLGQMEVSKPTRMILQQLTELGLLTVKSEITPIDFDGIVEESFC